MAGAVRGFAFCGGMASVPAFLPMPALPDLPLSVLDLSPIVEGGTAADAFRCSLDLAQHAERWGYRRYWLAEHHNMPGIASAATAVVIGHIAAGTSRIRVGSGGTMLPNHAPLVITEQFGTLEALYPGRIDLGLGRAPGTDPRTTTALRRDPRSRGTEFPDLLKELRAFFQPVVPGQTVQAVPGAGARVPIWLLGSSDFSARLAGELGLPFAAAGHFAPDNLLAGLAAYRDNFRPSANLAAPCAMVGVTVIAADTDAAAQRLATSQQQAIINLFRGRPTRLPEPVANLEGSWTEDERAGVESFMRLAIIGGPDTVRRKLDVLIAQTQPDELIVNAMIHDHAARLHSYELLSLVSRS